MWGRAVTCDVEFENGPRFKGKEVTCHSLLGVCAKIPRPIFWTSNFQRKKEQRTSDP